MISLGHRVRWFVGGCCACAAAALILLSTGCSMKGSPPTAPGTTTSFAFVSNSGSASVSAFAVSSTGGLSVVNGSPFAAGAGAEFMAFDRAHNLLFVSNQLENSVSAFAVNTSTGMLTTVAGSPFSTAARPTAVAVDSAGRFLFAANQAASSISVFAIGAGGVLTPVSGSPFAAASPFGLAVNASGTLLFASNFPDSNAGDLNTISVFAIASSGGLTAVSGSPFADASTSSGFASVVGILADPSGKFLFAADHMAESVVSFNLNAATGALTPVTPLPAPATSCGTSCHHNPLRLAVDPLDKFIYWSNVQAGTVSGFNINNGNLAFVSETATGAHPFGLALDPTGQFLYVVNKSDKTISGFAVNSSTGALMPLQGFPVLEGGAAPTDIVIVARTM